MFKKACPFCGSRSIKICSECCSYYLECEKCHGKGPDDNNHMAAFKKWNTRKKPQKLSRGKSILSTLSLSEIESLREDN